MKKSAIWMLVISVSFCCGLMSSLLMLRSRWGHRRPTGITPVCSCQEEVGVDEHAGTAAPTDAWIEKEVKALSDAYESDAYSTNQVEYPAAIARMVVSKERCVPVLLRMLDSESQRIGMDKVLWDTAEGAAMPGVKRGWAGMYGMFFPAAWLQPVFEKALQSKDEKVRLVGLLGFVRNADAGVRIPLLLEMLADASVNVRTGACLCLCITPGDTRDEVIEALVQALDDESVDVRCAAMSSLAVLGATEAVPFLVKALDDARAVDVPLEMMLTEDELVYGERFRFWRNPPRAINFRPTVRQLGVTAIRIILDKRLDDVAPYWDTQNRMDEVVKKVREFVRVVRPGLNVENP
jgi:HEAT repeats